MLTEIILIVCMGIRILGDVDVGTTFRDPYDSVITGRICGFIVLSSYLLAAAVVAPADTAVV